MGLALSRQQKRASERQNKKQVTYNMTRSQVEATTRQSTMEHLEEIKQDLSVYYTKVIASAFLVNLHDKHGFGEKRLKGLLKSIEETMGSVMAGKVEVDDLVKICKEEFDIDVV